MNVLPLQATFQILRVGQRAIDKRQTPPRDLSLIGLARCKPEKDNLGFSDRFYEDMAGHCADIVQLHNRKLISKRGSSRHAQLQRNMYDTVRQVVGDAPFGCFGSRFGPTCSKSELPGPEYGLGFQVQAFWRCYWIVFSLETLACELHDDGCFLVRSYVECLFNWWQLVQAHGVEAVNAAICAPLPPLELDARNTK